jgi:Uma2 family endonuclease
MSTPLHESFFLTTPPGEDELPYSDGEPMDSELHAKQQTLLVSSLDRAWEARDDFYVGGNMFVYYSLLQTKKNDFRGPDVFVVLDTTRRVRKSWVVWGEGGRTPDVVIELLSETTEHVDRGEKMRIYAKLLHVSGYYLFDPLTGLLEGYALDPATRAFARTAPGPGGDLPCPALGLRLGVRRGLYQGVEADWLRWLDTEGRPLPTDEELARAAKAQARAAEAQARAAEQRGAEQAKAREEAELRLGEALAEIERLKASRAG